MRKLLVIVVVGATLFASACGSFGNDRRAQLGRAAPAALVAHPK